MYPGGYPNQPDRRQQPQNGYAQQPYQGYQPPQNAQQGNPYANPYAQQPGTQPPYTQGRPQAPYAAPQAAQQPGMGTGFIQQRPSNPQRAPYPPQPVPGNMPPYPPQYPQNGQNAQQPMGYPQQQGYPRQPMPPMPYGQPMNAPMGYPQPMYAQAPMPRRPFPRQLAQQVLLFGLVPLLFVLTMVFPTVAALKIAFLAGALLTLVWVWVQPMVSSNLRLTMTAVLAAFSVVALVSLLTTNAPGDRTQQATLQPTPPTVVQIEPTAAPTEAAPALTTVAQDGLQSEAAQQLTSFFYFWQTNNIDNMLTLCAPSWANQVDMPKNELFKIMANRTPVDYSLEKITGTENDTTRAVTLSATLDKGNGREPSKYRMQVLMTKENDVWYVDPRSLTSQEALDATPTPEATETPAPTDAPSYSSSTKLYYNPKGGTLYHIDPKCRDVHKKYLPMTSFTYGELNNAPYDKLERCRTCNAPKRQK